MLDYVRKLSESVKGRAVITVVGVAILLQCYSLVNRVFAAKVDFMLPIDALIPFVPWTLLIYVSFYLLLLLAAMVCEGREFLRLAFAMVAVEVVCFFFFAIVTAHYPRPPLDSFTSLFWRRSYALLYACDGPGNTFPSIHASMALIVGWRLRVQKNKWWWFVWGALIAISTLSTKQHYVMDVLAGIVLAIVVCSLFFRRGAGGSQ